MQQLRELLSDPGQLADLIGLAQGPDDALGRKACCASLYDSAPVRLLLGDTLHPGGLALTHRLGKLVGIQRDQLVLDLACGRGASAMAVARSFHCRVVGVDLGVESVAAAALLAGESNLDSRVIFLRGDGESLPLAPGSFDAALCECSMSLFPDKSQGVAEIARLLRPGGRLGISDVTVEPGCLPEALSGTVGQMLCVADAPSVEGYRELLRGGGLKLVQEQDASDSISKLLRDVEGKLAAFRFLQKLRGPSGDGYEGLIAQVLGVLEQVKGLVGEGKIGYRLFVAEKDGP